MKSIAPIIPVWAESIEVARRGRNRLIVRGTERNSYPIIPKKSEVVIQALSRNPKKPIHMEFASARSLDALLKFVRAHGPIRGKLEGRPQRKNGKEELTVREDLDALTREQKLFRAAVLLLSELQAKRQDRVKIRNLVSQIREFYPTQTIGEKWSGIVGAGDGSRPIP